MAVTKTIKTSGGDYSSLAAAIAGESATVGELVFDCYALDVGDGFTTGMQCGTLLIQANASARHAGVYLSDVSAVARTSGFIALNATVPILQTVDGLTAYRSPVPAVGIVGAGQAPSAVIKNVLGQDGGNINVTPFQVSSTMEIDNCVLYGDGQIAVQSESDDSHFPIITTVVIKHCSYIGGAGGFYLNPISPDAETVEIQATVDNSVWFGDNPFFVDTGSGGLVFAALFSCAGPAGSDSSATSSTAFISTTLGAAVAGVHDATPLTGSPLRNAGDNTRSLPTDINGVTRPQQTNVYVGAFETFTSVVVRVIGFIRNHRIF